MLAMFEITVPQQQGGTQIRIGIEQVSGERVSKDMAVDLPFETCTVISRYHLPENLGADVTGDVWNTVSPQLSAVCF